MPDARGRRLINRALTMLAGLRAWAATVKRDVVAIALAARDPRTPLVAKLLALAIVAYALSPIDLIPDVIPVLGMLDDLLLLPLGLWVVVRLIPRDVLAEYRAAATGMRLAPSRAGAVVIVALWLAALSGVAWISWRWMAGS